VFEEQYVCIILPVHILFDQADLLLLFYALLCCILVTMVISCICSFGNVCFVLSHCHMSVQPLFDRPLIGTVSNALGTVTLHFLLCVQALCSCLTWRFIFCSLLLFRKEIAASYQDIRLFVGCISLRSLVIYYSLLSSCRFFIRRHLV